MRQLARSPVGPADPPLFTSRSTWMPATFSTSLHRYTSIERAHHARYFRKSLIHEPQSNDTAHASLARLVVFAILSVKNKRIIEQ